MADPKAKSPLKAKSDAKIMKSPTKRRVNTRRPSLVDDATFLMLAVNSFKSPPDYVALADATGMPRKSASNRICTLRNKYLPADPMGMEGLKAKPSKSGDNKQDALDDSDEGAAKGDKE